MSFLIMLHKKSGGKFNEWLQIHTIIESLAMANLDSTDQPT